MACQPYGQNGPVPAGIIFLALRYVAVAMAAHSGATAVQDDGAPVAHVGHREKAAPFTAASHQHLAGPSLRVRAMPFPHDACLPGHAAISGAAVPAHGKGR